MFLNSRTSGRIQVSDFSCSNLPRIGLLRRLGSFYLRVSVDNQVEWTPASQRSENPKWSSDLRFETAMMDKGLMNVQVHARRSTGNDDLVGELETLVEIGAFIDGHDDKDIRQSLFRSKRNGRRTKIQGTIQFKLQFIPSTSAESDAGPIASLLDAASNAVDHMQESSQGLTAVERVVKQADAIVQDIENAYDIWQLLLDRVDIVVKAIDTISEIHPYVRMAWSVLSLPVDAVIAQINRDQAVRRLLEMMKGIYEVMSAEDRLKDLQDLPSRRRTVKLIIQQTAECAWFVSDYASRKYVKRVMKGMTTSFSKKVDEYCETFQKLKDEFMYETTQVTAITVFQLSPKVDEILSELKDASALQHLNEMHCVKGQDLPDGCLPETRQSVIDDIIDWFSQPVEDNGSQLFWLSGVAGCGKSAIARSVSDMFIAQKRCARFFFKESNQTQEGPDRLFATLSRQLSGLDDGWKAYLVKILKDSMTTRESRMVQTQFDELFVGPARQLDGLGPILIVIDALDESGSREQREKLMATLKRINDLPSQFRFLITSRPETDIGHAFRDKSWARQQQLHDTDTSSTDKDISHYVSSHLKDIPGLNSSYIGSWTDDIVSHSGQLFQWAVTACKYIQGNNEVDCYLERKEDISSSAYPGLDGLYNKILTQQWGFKIGDRAYHRFQNIMGRILLVREPLSMNDLSELWYDEEDRTPVQLILSRFGSLLSGVSPQDHGKPVQALHVSFLDFLRDEKRSQDFHIKGEEANERLTSTLFRVMNDSLRFNICSLATSYKRNSDVEDLDSRIAESIRPHLDYACRYWADHLSQIKATALWIGRIDGFMHNQLLFWFEVLSLLKKMSTGLRQLLVLQEWLESQESADELKLFIRDAFRFGASFGRIGEESTPHLYLSALPFIPTSSPVSQAYLAKFPGSVCVHDKHKIIWPQQSLTINVPSAVNAVAFSPNSKQVISGLSDGTVVIWDAGTGEIVAGPFQGHTDWVTSVGFSPDGNRVVSGSGDETVIIWDVGTGEIVAGPFQGHTDCVTSVGFSPDGNRVVSGSRNKTGIIWDVGTGEIVAGPFQGHTDWVTSVGFSPDGNRVISGSRDKTVIIWDVGTGEIVAGPFQGHTDCVTSVGFLPDGNRVVSGSGDKTVIIWDAGTGEIVAGPFQGHTNWVTSVGFSPDGNRVVSGSDDKTVIIWDAGTVVSSPHNQATINIDSKNPSSSIYSLSSINPENQLLSSSSYSRVVEAFISRPIGWALDKDKNIIFWTPEVYRAHPWAPGIISVMSTNHILLNMLHFSHGATWTKCFQS